VQIFKHHPSLSPKQVSTIIRGFHELNYADYRTLNRDIVVYGAREIGMYPLDPKRILKNCTHNWADGDIDYIIRILPALRNLFGEHGRVPDSDMDVLKFPTSIHEKSHDKDGNALIHERCVWVNHNSTSERNKYAEASAKSKAAKKRQSDAKNATMDPLAFATVMKMYTNKDSLDLLPASTLKGALRHMKSHFRMSIAITGTKPVLVQRLMNVLNQHQLAAAT